MCSPVPRQPSVDDWSESSAQGASQNSSNCCGANAFNSYSLIRRPEVTGWGPGRAENGLALERLPRASDQPVGWAPLMARLPIPEGDALEQAGLAQRGGHGSWRRSGPR